MKALDRKVALLLGRLAFSTNDIQQADAMLSDHPVNLENVARILHENKVIPTALENLASIRHGHELSNILQENAGATAKIDAYRTTMFDQLSDVVSILNKKMIRPLVIKGASLFFLLPSYGNRFMRDLDFLVEDVSSLWSAGRALMSAGYIVDEEEGPWLQNFSHSPCGSLDAHLTLLSRTGRKVEIHSRNMAIADIGMMESQLWQRAVAVNTPTGTVLVPTPEDAVLVLLAHSSNHGYLTIKDLNDMYALTKLCGLDWNYIIECSRQNALGPYLGFCITALKEYYGAELDLPQGALRRIRCPWYIAMALSASFRVNLPSTQCVRNTLGVLAMYYEASKRSRLSAVYHYLRERWEGYRMTKYDTWPQGLQELIDRAERRPFFAPIPKFGVQVMLAPISPDVCGQWVKGSYHLSLLYQGLSKQGMDVRCLIDLDSLLVETSWGEILVTPCGLFLPTRRSVFFEDDLVELTNVCDKIVEISRHILAETSDSRV